MNTTVQGIPRRRDKAGTLTGFPLAHHEDRNRGGADMDFERYKAIIGGFDDCFTLLGMVDNFKQEPKTTRDTFTSILREMMTGDKYLAPSSFHPLPVKWLASTNAVNLGADLETITRQAEAVKQEIIELGKMISIMAPIMITNVI